MRISKLVPRFAVVAALTIGSNALAVSYEYDNGTPTNAVGYGGFGNVWWGNLFTVEPGGETITSLKYMVGYSIPDPTFQALLYSGNPMTGLTLVRDVTAATTPGEWQEVDIPDTVMTGDFVVAAMTYSYGGYYPALFDETVAAGKSWLAVGTYLDPADPAAYSPIGLSPIERVGPGTFMIRANGTSATNAVPEPLTLCGLMLSACGLVSYVRKRRLAA